MANKSEFIFDFNDMDQEWFFSSSSDVTIVGNSDLYEPSNKDDLADTDSKGKGCGFIKFFWF